MSIELKIPSVGESISEVQIGAWRKSPGETVAEDEIVAELETDKATFELPAPAAGVLTKILKKAGESASVGEVIAYLGDGSEADKSWAKEAPREEKKGEPPREAKQREAPREEEKREGPRQKAAPEPARRETPPEAQAKRDEAAPAKPQAREKGKESQEGEVTTREAPAPHVERERK